VYYEPSPAENQMPILDNPKHERFCQALAKGETGDQAYITAGYKENRGNAARLKAKESIIARVVEILEKAAVRTEITVQSLTDMYLDDRRLARALGQIGVSKGAADSIAKLHGLMIDRAVLKNVNEFDDMDEQKLLAWIEEKLNRYRLLQ
jgi:phage terminase small subunit